MLEEVTPEIVGLSLFLITLVTPVLTLVLSALLLWGYGRAVARAMATSAFDASIAATMPPVASHATPAAVGGLTGSDLYQVAIAGPRHYALHYTLAGLAFAAVFAVAARFVYPI